MANSLTSTWNELHGLLALIGDAGEPVASLAAAGVRKVYKGEPMAGYQEAGVIITSTPNGIGDNYYFIALRVYASLTVQPVKAQESIAATLDALEAVLDRSNFERSDWEIGPNGDLECWIAETILQRGREWG